MRSWWRNGWRDAVALSPVLGWLVLETGSGHRWAPWYLICGVAAVLVAAATARSRPIVALTVGCAVCVPMLFQLGWQVSLWPLGLLGTTAFLTGRRLGAARPALGCLMVFTALTLPLSVVVSRDGAYDWMLLATAYLFLGLFPWQIGRYLRLRATVLDTGWSRAKELEAGQRLVAEQARLRERARIASDMHDSLGHELSLIAVRASAFEVAPGLDERGRAAARELRESAAAATERLREIIGVLRADADGAPTEPVDDTIGALVDRATASGMAVTATITEDAPPPPMVGRAAYRVVQESLTNAAKHASGATVTVRVVSADAQTTVDVLNDPPPDTASLGVASGGHGLTGLRERVRLVGGTLGARPLDGGFVVHAVLPHHGEPGEPAESASESALALERARHQVRRGFVRMFAVPAVAVALIALVSGILYVYNWFGSQLDESAYAAMRIGQPRHELAGALPGRQHHIPSALLAEPPAPFSATCAYYGDGAHFLEPSERLYRLCFTDGVLVAKDIVRERDE